MQMKAEIRRHHGTPTLFLNGQPTFDAIMWGHSPANDGYGLTECVRAYARAGIHTFTFDVGTAGVNKEWCGPGPGHEGDTDFSTLGLRLGRVIEADPQAMFHLRVHMELRLDDAWWHERYPEERELADDGMRIHQSLASTVWREQANAFLREYVAQVKAQGLEERVIAYQVGAGDTSEWVKGTASMAARSGDFSQPMRRYFRGWLRKRYADDVAALRAAWNDGRVDYDTAEVPSGDRQRRTLNHIFRDPTREGQVIDYYRALADLAADLVNDYCHTVKVATQGNALAGAFFGYLLELAWNMSFFGAGVESEYSTYQRSGHLGLGQVLRSPDVDFIVSPYSYGFRGIGGHGPGMPPSESLRVHNKLYIYEEDSRVYPTPISGKYGQVATVPDSVAMLTRNYAEVLTRGQGVWWLGGSPGNPMNDPSVVPDYGPLLARFRELGDWSIALDRRPSAEVAVLLDDESFYYQTIRNDLDLPLIFQQRLWGLPRMGAPADYYLLQDLLEGRLPPYKLYVFLNPWHLDDARRQALDRELKRDGRTALWIYAPGYLKDDASLDHMAALTGFRFGQSAHPWGPLMHIVDADHAITQAVPQDLFWGTNALLGPNFYLDDPDARVLAQVVLSEGECKPGLGVREFEGWKSVYVAAPNIPAPVLRGIARYAGVHLYSEAGDVLYATPELLSVHTAVGGPRTFTLPKKAEVVYDLMEKQLLARNAAAFTVRLAPRSTRLFFAGAEKQLAGLSEKAARP
jgi:hypothetical protein